MALSLIDYEGLSFPPDDWVIPGLGLARQNTAFMIGPPKKAAKSWMMLAAGWDLSEGLPVWEIAATKPARPMRTVYFAQEDTKKNAYDRIMAHVGRGRKTNNGLWIISKDLNHKLDTDMGKVMVEKELDGVVKAAGAIDLVMFDPMRRIHNGNENDSDTIAKIWEVIDRIHKRYNCATMISHHISKPPTDKKGYDPTDPYNGRGSGDIYGGGDAFIMVSPGALSADRLQRTVSLYFESKRDQEMAPANLRVWFKTGRVEYLGEAKPRINNLGVDG